MKTLILNRKSLVLVLTAILIVFGTQGSYGQTLTASTPQPLTEATLDGSIVTLTLSGRTFERPFNGLMGGQAVAGIRGVKVSGIPGLTIPTTRVPFNIFINGVQQFGTRYAIDRISDTELEVELAFDGNLDSDATITFTVEAEAIEGYDGSALTADISVAASAVSTPSHLSIYWIDWLANKIQRSNLDGSNVEDLVTGTQGLQGPQGIALDIAGGKMYWTDSIPNKIQRSNLDGSNVEDLVTGTQGLQGPQGIALDVAGGKMYWTDIFTDKIQRSNLDGSNVEDLVTGTQGLQDPTSIALDVAGGKMYWTDRGTDKIQRSNLDGSNVEDLVTIGLQNPLGIALNVTGGKMYWTDSVVSKIQRSNLDGSNVEDLVTTGLGNPVSIALDVAGGKMYWTDLGTRKIQRSNLDGSNVEDLVTGLRNPRGIAISISPSALPIVRPMQPDLVVESVQVEPATVTPGQEFKLYATLRNSGTGESAVTTVRYYQSTNNIISTQNTQLGTGRRNPLAANATIRRYLSITAPTTPGTYYYGVCVDSVPNESNTDNNCSAAVSITVQQPPIVSIPSHLSIYWTDVDTDKIQRANLDGSNVEDLVTGTQGLQGPWGIALDVAGGKMYWTDVGTDKIQRANLDGSNVEDLVTTGLETPHGIALDVAGGKMYWTDVGTDKIQRANLDGSNVEDLVTTGLETPEGIALEVVGGKMYWADWGTDKIQRANLDGSNVEDLVTGGAPSGIALDVADGKMYWTDFVENEIQRANLDGSDVEDLVTTGLETPSGIALDVAGDKMYWTDWGEIGQGARWGKEKIRRANLDGSNVEDLVTYLQGLRLPTYIAISISPSTPPIVREDVNRDGVVDVQDIVYVAQRYGRTGQNQADVNGDGVVNVDDLIVVAAVVDSTPAAPAARSGIPKDLTAGTVNQWVTEAKLTGKKTPTYQRGILTLEQLLAVLTPKETALLANYPNPFNPETWIPYHLANDSDVLLSIYDINGALVRELNLGHQRAGYYTDRSRAAYWDGRNEWGEQVVSGVYFYQLRAGDYSQMRKMVIVK